MSRIEDLFFDAIELARQRLVIAVALAALVVAVIISLVVLGSSSSPTSIVLSSTTTTSTPAPATGACLADQNAIKAVIKQNPAINGRAPAPVMASYRRSFARMLHACSASQVTAFDNQEVLPWIIQMQHTSSIASPVQPKHRP